MAITINAEGFTTVNGPSTATVSLNIAAGTNTLLHVVIYTYGVVSGVTWNGVAITLDALRTVNGSRKAYHAYQAAPTTGTHDVVVTMSSADFCAVQAIAADGVEQSSHIRGYLEQYTSVSTPEDFVPSGALNDDLLLAVIEDATLGASAQAANTGSTVTGSWAGSTGAVRRIASADSQGAGITWSGGAAVMGVGAVALKAVASASGGGPLTGGLTRSTLTKGRLVA